MKSDFINTCWGLSTKSLIFDKTRYWFWKLHLIDYCLKFDFVDFCLNFDWIWHRQNIIAESTIPSLSPNKVDDHRKTCRYRYTLNWQSWKSSLWITNLMKMMQKTTVSLVQMHQWNRLSLNSLISVNLENWTDVIWSKIEFLGLRFYALHRQYKYQ